MFCALLGEHRHVDDVAWHADDAEKGQDVNSFDAVRKQFGLGADQVVRVVPGDELAQHQLQAAFWHGVGASRGDS